MTTAHIPPPQPEPTIGTLDLEQVPQKEETRSHRTEQPRSSEAAGGKPVTSDFTGYQPKSGREETSESAPGQPSTQHVNRLKLMINQLSTGDLKSGKAG